MDYEEKIKKILDAGIALSREKECDALYEMILERSMEIANCDGGIFYICKQEQFWGQLAKVSSVSGDGDRQEEAIFLCPMDSKGKNVCTYTMQHKKIVNIADIYKNMEFDLSTFLKYDQRTGYHTQSLLGIPLINKEDEIVGVLQLMNAQDEQKNVVAFDQELEYILLALASMAAIAISNLHYLEEIKEQMWSFTEAMAEAIDSRTPYNANHVRNVAVYAKKIAEYCNQMHAKGLEKEYFDENRKEQLVLSALLHDLGKIAISSRIMNKSTKLENQLPQLEKRLELLGLKYKILCLEKRLTKEAYDQKITQLKEVYDLVIEVNSMSVLTEEMKAKLEEAFLLTYQDEKETIPYFTKEEQEALLIERGTLTEQERRIMESHVEVTERILRKVHFHDTYKNAPKFAAEHHEYLNGMGYPRGLQKEQLCLESRILAVADICDALLATDRPYKQPLPKQEAFAILRDMADAGQIDKTIVAYLEACL